MSRDYVSEVKIQGAKDRLETFCNAFTREGFEHVKPFETDMDHDTLVEWRNNNWGVFYNPAAEMRRCKITEEGELHLSVVTSPNFPVAFFLHISSMYTFRVKLSSCDMVSDTFVNLEMINGELTTDVRSSCFSEEAIDFYGEKKYEKEVMEFLEIYLDSCNVKVSSLMLEAFYQHLLGIGVKKILTDDVLFESEIKKILEDMI